jgi:leucine dehydrogenase
VTAHGVFVGIKSALKKTKGMDNLSGVKVAVQGAAGHVGFSLCKELYENGAKLYVSDFNDEGLKKLVKEMKAEVVGPDDIYGLDVDVYAPCALGATINDKTISQFKCSIIAGSANNQLLDEKKHGVELKKRGILYAPDYVINAGGLINVSSEVYGGGTDHAWAKTEEIYSTLLKIYDIADAENISTAAAAGKMAEQRISDISNLKKIRK